MAVGNLTIIDGCAVIHAWTGMIPVQNPGHRPMSFATADLCDRNENQVRVCQPIFRDFGAITAFHGPIVTIDTFEDNSRVREALEQPGQGRVLVVDGGGSMRRALLGGNLAQLAQRNGWSGLVIHGCVRDSAEVAAARIGVKALATHPMRPSKGGFGRVDIPVTFAGVTFHPGDHLYADSDGIVVSTSPFDVSG